MTQFGSMWCPVCNRQTQCVRQPTNHVLHLLITLFFCGAWLPVWIWVAFFGSLSPYFCNACGTKKWPWVSIAISGGLVATLGCLVAFVGFAIATGSGRPAGPPSSPAANSAPPVTQAGLPAKLPEAEQPGPAQPAAALPADSPRIPVDVSKPADTFPPPFDVATIKEVPDPPKKPKKDPRTRTFQSESGKFSVEATFLFRTPDGVHLRKVDGSEIVVPLEKLSDEDQSWIKMQGKR
jgi:hypothetical protein